MANFKALPFGVSVAAALFVGATSFMPPAVYAQWWWFLFWGLVAAGIVLSAVRFRLWRRPAVFALHLSFLLMLGGGALTALTARRGIVHLIPEVAVSDYVGADGSLVRLPFTLTLEKFEADYYPGMTFPRDFRSRVLLSTGDTLEISMNRIGRAEGWRLYQQSFDGRGGSILSVSSDRAGTAVTYSGYLLFALAGLGMLRRRRKAAAAACLVAFAGGYCSAAPAVSTAVADSLEGRQVEFNGRVVPFATMASELSRKIVGRDKVGSLTATRFVASLIMFPQEWREVAFLKTAEGYRSVASLYGPGGEYLPQKEYEGGKDARDSEILKVDEKVALLASLWQGTLFTPLAEDSPLRRSEVSIRSELIWLRLQPVRLFFIATLLCAFGGLLLRRFPLRFAAAGLGVCGAGIMAWRAALTGYFPLASTGEIMFFVGVALCFVAAVAGRVSGLGASLGLLAAGFAGLLSWLAVKDPVMTPLMPVLASPWLSVHVSLVMVAYALLGFTFPLALAALVLPKRQERLTSLSRSVLAPGVYILGLGIMVGAMWANVSWGRYWAWDPKETWALVTMLLYAVPLHPSLGLSSRPRLLNLYLVFAFMSVVMTYAGVNYLPSLHAYR